ncbi:synaptic vesicle 2-related protein [Procambarus clarkii]|uniref:synaptic vesicle 2-related protein n=1 Tax=Procambarus clarkii TaxID=6728 RepID=UPI001E67331C|nr:synaptic vesicle 2-related protein-like [Procambarus clarkii]XP_045607808.1 synaptic vesicle 2-related protein-like [Procambarus clarkii]
MSLSHEDKGPYEEFENDGNSSRRERTSHRESSSTSSGSAFSSLDPGAHIEMSAAVSGVVPDDTFTVDQAVNALGFGKFQVKLSLITGLCWMADSMEMMILAILGPALHCDWHLSEWKQAFLTTAVFIGMMLSSAFWGNLSDKYGRKKSLRLAAVMLAYWGLLSAFAPTYNWIVLLRGLVGFAIGCVPQSVTLYAEFLPAHQRGKCVVLLDCFWAVGACAEVILALWVMPTMGWTGLLGLSIIPLVLFVLVCQWLPESARFDATSGDSEKALATLQKIADENGKPMLLGRLIVDDVAQMNRGRIKDLLVQDLKWTTLLLWFIWSSCAFCYYGVVLMTTELFEAKGNLCALSGMDGAFTCTADCRPLSSEDYLDLLWTTLAEFPGIFFTILVIERLGRKTTMALEFGIFVISIIMLFICTSNRTWLTFILFVARGIISGVFQAAYVYTPEVYPTSLRAVGVGTCSGMARFGAMLTPIVAQVLTRTSIHLATATYGIVAVLAIAAALMLPIETRGRAMS